MNRRKLNHENDSLKEKKVKFHEAISTYGADAFIWTQIDTAETINELAKKEKKYVLEYNSKVDGYNSDNGGGIKKHVYQYSLNGDFLKMFDCLEKAGTDVNAKKQQISRACLNKKTSKGFFWSYDYVEKFEPAKDYRKKVVQQFTLDGNFVCKYNSVAEASKQTNCNTSSIAKVCRGERKTAGGFNWAYSS
uniref:NUMOD1 domain-containing DNA-binding protein n=1 Tax=uncultured Polaribacter sp. TaxID=174711 RepID=UPI00345BC3E1